jgi:hypothetical protein
MKAACLKFAALLAAAAAALLLLAPPLHPLAYVALPLAVAALFAR